MVLLLLLEVEESWIMIASLSETDSALIPMDGVGLTFFKQHSRCDGPSRVPGETKGSVEHSGTRGTKI